MTDIEKINAKLDDWDDAIDSDYFTWSELRDQKRRAVAALRIALEYQKAIAEITASWPKDHRINEILAKGLLNIAEAL
jgi:hypothetical protein